MDSLDLYTMPSSPSFFSLLGEDERQDFTLGAKPTSFLHPATLSHPETNATATYDLPEWMEGREMIGLPPDNLPPAIQTSTPFTTTTTLDTNLITMDDDYCLTIKPEDMLVPLSEYQSPSSSPLAPSSVTPLPTSPANSITSPSPNPAIVLTAPANTTLAPYPTTYVTIPSPPLTPPPPPTTEPNGTFTTLIPAATPTTTTTAATLTLPKIIICRKVTAPTRKAKSTTTKFQIKPVEKLPPKPLSQAAIQPVETPKDDLSVIPYQGMKCDPIDVIPEPHVQPPSAEEFIDELVKMIGDSSGGGGSLENLENLAFNASEMESCMEDLLTQLETEPDSQPSGSYTAALSCSSIPSVSESPSSPAPPILPLPSPSPVSPVSPASPLTQPLSPGSSSASSPFPASPPSPTPSETPSSSYLPSPVPSFGSLSPSQTSESFFSVEEEEEEWSSLEETHSYSKSRKAKSSRRTSGVRRTPYPEDRKERKKEQNKQAALRYRQKKRQEEDEMSEKIRVEEERQRELKGKYNGLKQELGYLKKIMREVFVARGLVSEEALKKAAQEKRRRKH